MQRGIRGVIAAARHASQLSTSRSLPLASLAPSSAVAWRSSDRSFSHVAGSPEEHKSETPAVQPLWSQPKATRPKKDSTLAQEAARQTKHLKTLQANAGDVDVALEVFGAIQSASGSGLSQDVATALVTTFAHEKKLDRAVQVLKLAKKRQIHVSVPPYQRVMTSCYKANMFDAALEVLDLLHGVKLTPSSVMHTTALLSAHKACKRDLVPKILEQMLTDAKPHESRAFQTALSAARNSREHELVLELVDCSKTLDVQLASVHYHLILKSYAVVGNLQAALSTRDTLQQEGFDLTDDGIYWLVYCASKTGEWDLVQSLLGSPSLSTDTEKGVAAAVNAFNAAIAAYGNREHWNKVVDVYDIMPENLRAELKGWHLRTVIVALAKAESKEVKLRALEVFNEHKEKADDIVYSGAITALLEMEQFDAVLALAEEMKTKEIAWGKSVYQALALTVIRRGTTEEAVQLLEASVRRMEDDPQGYTDIMQFYTDRIPHHGTEKA